MPDLPTTTFRVGVALGVGVTLALLSCVYDPNHVCGPNQVKDPKNADQCLCVEGTVLDNGQCIACGQHEVFSGGVCACAVGFARDTDGGPCAATGLGADCSSTPCPDSRYPTCERVAASGTDAGAGGAGGTSSVDAGTRGYCTNSGCASNTDCAQGWACDTSVTPSVCLRPPLGQGQPCTQASDCAGTAATFCDLYISHVCLVRGCTLGGNDCFLGWECCDVTPRGLAEHLCVPIGQCPK